MPPHVIAPCNPFEARLSKFMLATSSSRPASLLGCSGWGEVTSMRCDGDVGSEDCDTCNRCEVEKFQVFRKRFNSALDNCDAKQEVPAPYRN